MKIQLIKTLGKLQPIGKPHSFIIFYVYLEISNLASVLQPLGDGETVLLSIETHYSL